jgi:hypothetical protein
MRNSSLIAQRNAAISARFTELYEKSRTRYDDVIVKLQQEFFLSKITVERILKQKPNGLPETTDQCRNEQPAE